MAYIYLEELKKILPGILSDCCLNNMSHWEAKDNEQK